MSFNPGEHIGAYELLSRCGSGAYGEVFVAVNSLTGERVALKVLRRSSKILKRELNGLIHYRDCRNAHLIRIRHVEEFQDSLYYTMDLADDLNGGCGDYLPDTLANRLERQHHLPPDAVAELADALKEALNTLHASGLIHRDVKPGNILWINGVPVLGDAGLIGDAQHCSLVGTPEFMPPELLRREREARPEDDFFALSRVLYCVFTGNAPANYPCCPEGLLNAENADLWQRILEPEKRRDAHVSQKKHLIWYLVAAMLTSLILFPAYALLRTKTSVSPREAENQEGSTRQTKFMLDRGLPKLLKQYEDDDKYYQYYRKGAEIHSRTFYENLDFARRKLLFEREFTPLSEEGYRTRCDELERNAASGMKRDLYLRLHECQLRLTEQLERAHMYPFHASGNTAENAERQFYSDLHQLFEERRALMERLAKGNFAGTFALPHSLWNFVEELGKESPRYHWGEVAKNPKLGIFYERHKMKIRELAAKIPHESDSATVKNILNTTVGQLSGEEKLTYGICTIYALYADCREWKEQRAQSTPENIRFYAELFRLNRDLVERLYREYPEYRP